MKYLLLISFLLTSFINTTKAQNKPAYQLFKSDGKVANYDKMIKDLADSDMVFFGEYHYNPIAHWLQLEVSKNLFDIKEILYFLEQKC
ncbi:ChaN family lipoprotein [Polaribacter atrinae]|uniref:ChaN family lipoprotein n=1 Tax=Polaribacter atrinae TaxID=1333662 RepID=UPI000B26D79A|nr:ChaN family lipoprotein [Polaribacter atrinae]